MSTFDSEGTKLEIETWKILDQLRARLQALVGGLTVMQSEIGNPNGRLPPWPQFQTSMNRVQREMNEVVQYLKEQQEAVSSIVVVPDPKFPLQQQHILDTLMRTKMEPATEEWIDQNLKAAREKEKEDSQFSAGFGGQNNRLSEEDREKFWLSAVLTANLEGRKHVWGADFTMAEKELGCENIDTGLLRELEVPPTPDPYTNEDLSGEEEDEDQYQEGDIDVEGGKYPDAGSRMDIDQTKRGGAAENSGVVNSIPSMPIDAIHKFMTKDRERASARFKARKAAKAAQAKRAVEEVRETDLAKAAQLSNMAQKDSQDTTKRLTREEVAKNNTEESLWMIIDHKVYDLTDFIDAHPGGNVVLQQVAGQDATTAFYNLHRHEVLQKYPDLCIGTIEGEKPEVIEPHSGDLSQVPYGEPLWLTPVFKSPYYKESHHKLRKAMREFVDEHITPEAQEKELDGTYISQELTDKMAANNLLAMRLGPGKHLYGRGLLGGVKGEEFDYFHDLIVAQELSRANARGFQDGNMAGMMISLTAVRQWLNNEALRDKVTEECLSGKKFMCLAITEAFAGSDVAGLRTTAEKTPDGKHYIINGTKKWITNGMFADYFVTGCRTKKGFSVILVPRSEGVETKRIKTAYSAAAATTYIQFENVHVPVDHLLGKEDNGFMVIMSNFNHERWAMACSVIRWMRTVTEECMKWANQRIVFGKQLNQQPVIRQKLAKMISLTEACQAQLEIITYQMCNMTYAQQSKLLGGPIGLLKSYATRCAHDVADDAVNIFGGRGITQTGMGRVVEQFHRTYKFDAILGGTEEILADLGVRQAMKLMPKAML